MSEPATDVWDEIPTPVDVEPDQEFTIPDRSASREERRSFLSYLNGSKKEEETTTRRAPRKRKRPASRSKKGVFVEPLTQLYGVAALTLAPLDEHCAGVILQNAETCATAIDELAYQNESVRRVLDTLVTGSAIGAVVMAHLPIMVAIAAHHGGGKFFPKVVEESETDE